MEKARDNLAAIELAQRIDAEKRPATQAEQKVLAKYVGWGGLSGAFRNPETNLFGKGFEPIGTRLKELLTPEAYDQAENSTQYAHYTAEHVIRSMWDAVQQLGFKGGSVFEPGMGIGHFVGLMPPDIAAASQYRGIEMDHTTAQIARLLYPRSGVKQADFRKFPLAEEAFDLVIGNPPFSDAVVKSDAKYAPRRFALHDYFFAKSLDAVRPGGLLAFITSAGTMNKLDDKARKYLAERAEFLGAVRMPSNAFKQNAGTEVTTDILFFQRRPEGKVKLEALPDWTQTVVRAMPNRDGEIVQGNVNKWFSDRPETVLGDEGFFDKLVAGADRYAVRPRKDVDLPTELAEALSTILPHDVMTEPESPEDRAAIDFDATQRKDGTFYIGADGRLMRYSQGAGHPVLLRGKQGGNFTKEDTDIITGLIPIRDALRDVFRGDLARDELVSGPAREALNKAYDAFVAKFGPINKAEYTYVKPTLVQIEEARLAAREEARSIDDYWNDGDFDPSAMIGSKASTTKIANARQFARDTAIAAGRKFNEGSFDPDDVPDTVRVKLLNIRPFRSDPESYRLRSIEEYNDTTGKGEKRDIFRRNILTFEEEPEIKSVEDGVLWSMNKLGRFDLDAIAEKMDRPRADIIEALGDKVFQVPNADDTYQTAEEYVSGDVVTKLEEAKKAAHSDADFERNVKALEAALPRPYAPGEIRINIGMPWIPQSVIQDFLEDHLDLGPTSVTFVPEVGAWSVVGSTTQSGGRRKKYSWEKDQVTAGTAQWGTADRTAHELVGDALNRTQIRISQPDPYDRKKTIFDPVATQLAVDKVEDIKQAFRDWVAADIERGDNLASIFNENLNRTVLRQFNGDYLKTPGIAAHWKWRPHQTRVVARIIQVGNTYMAHAVGAGKTSAMIGAGMEMRRLGLVKKPMYIVPNHMLGQFAKEFYEQYPTARIMVADEANFHTDTRKQFVSNVATSDLDAVIITHSSFGHIPISGEFQDHLIAEEVDILIDAIDQLDDQKDRITVKKLRNRIEKLREKLSGQGGTQKDQTFTFEEMGVDFLFVDEAHMFRKLSFATKLGNLKGIASDGSNMAWDLYTKTRYLETQRPGRSLVMASGTPVTNTMGELYTVSRYMQPQALAKNGVSHFDSWVQTFADTQTKLEQTPAGDYAPQTRLSNFMNMPTLYKMVAQGMDIVTSKELDQYVTRPKLMGDKRQFHLAPRTPVTDSYQAELAERVRLIKARRGPPEKGDDILLSVINDGRHAAIDPRFVMQTQNDPNSKLNMMLDNVARIYRETTDHQFYYPANDYAEKAFRGPATQMIFANLGVNPRGPMNFSGYAWMKAALMRQGIPANEIAFIGDYDTHVKRQSLFNDMNEGKVRILIGSVQKMGTGVNAQRRLVAVHNQDPLWFPADDEQRNGRMVRQGNMNPEVQIHDYSTKGTYDAVMWDMMGRKGRFIEQFFRGDPNLMEMEDLGEAGMFEQAAGMATTDERVLVLTEMKQELEKQERRAMGFEREQYEVRQKIKSAEWNVKYYTEMAEKAAQDIARRQDTRGKAFRMTVNGEEFTERKKATEALVAVVKDAREGMSKGSSRRVGSIGGFTLVFGRTDGDNYYAKLQGALDWSVYDDPEGTVMSAENKLRTIEEDREKWLKEVATYKAEAAAYRPQLTRKFEFGDQINELKTKVRALEAELKGESKKKEEDEQAAAAAAAAAAKDDADDDAAD
jgi:N12 class adenine-specific DNA methylase